MNRKRKRIIYSLVVEDAQTVSLEEIDRELTSQEIKMVEDLVGDNIDWYGALADAIHEAINAKKLPRTQQGGLHP